jgi:hypothetical protein
VKRRSVPAKAAVVGHIPAANKKLSSRAACREIGLVLGLVRSINAVLASVVMGRENLAG